MVIRRVAPESVARIYGVLGAGVGLIAGGFGAFFGNRSLWTTVAALIFAPIAYAIVSAISGAISAMVYNLAAGWFGGIEVDVDALAAGFDGQFFSGKDRS